MKKNDCLIALAIKLKVWKYDLSRMPELLVSETENIYLWVKRNRGVCSRIAREFEVTPSFVRSVLYGFCGSSERRIEMALIGAGATFVRERIRVS